jgi:hypothetical protein
MWLYLALVVSLGVILVRMESLFGKVITRIDAVVERFDYDWTLMSAELRISAYKRSGGLLCRAEQSFWALAPAMNMPIAGDWLIFEVRGGKTYRGEVVGREVRYSEVASRRSPSDTDGTRLHMVVRIDVICDDDESGPPSPDAGDSSLAVTAAPETVNAA